MKKEFYVIIEKDEDGFYVGEVPALEGCYAQERRIEDERIIYPQHLNQPAGAGFHAVAGLGDAQCLS